MTEAQTPTPLPEGSTAIQCILEMRDGQLEIVVNGLIIGGGDYDERNPCHRFLTVVADRLPEIMEAVGNWQTLRDTTSEAANDDAATDAVEAG